MPDDHDTREECRRPRPDRVKAIFLEAVALAEARERAAFLDLACESDPALRARVEELLRASDDPAAQIQPVPLALVRESLEHLAPGVAAALRDPVDS